MEKSGRKIGKFQKYVSRIFRCFEKEQEVKRLKIQLHHFIFIIIDFCHCIVVPFSIFYMKSLKKPSSNFINKIFKNYLK